jgi:hypothetical protein
LFHLLSDSCASEHGEGRRGYSTTFRLHYPRERTSGVLPLKYRRFSYGSSGIPEVEKFGRRYMCRLFGIPTYIHHNLITYQSLMSFSPAEESVISLPRMLLSDTPPCKLKRERQDSSTSGRSDDDERRTHAISLLSLASPEALSCSSTAATTPPRCKKRRSDFPGTISQAFSQIVRPPYEFVSAPLGNVLHTQLGHSAPESAAQSPPEVIGRSRARPYLQTQLIMIVDDVLDAHKDATRILNSDPLFPTGHATKTMHRAPRIHRSVGAINAGAVKGTKFVSFISLMLADMTLMKTFSVENLIC